jgi:putative adhesin
MTNRIFGLAVILFLVIPGYTRIKSTLAQTLTPSAEAAQDSERHYGRLRINAERGLKITLGNRTTGRITVNGWDRDVIEAHAVSERGKEVVIAILSNDSAGKKLFLKADYADLDQPSAPTTRVVGPPQANGGNLKVHFEVNVPRYVEIDLIRVWYSDVQITGVETAISVWGDQSSVILKRVGSVETRTRNGNVEVEHADGPVTITTTRGAVRVHKTSGNVRVVSISGPIEIKCVQGRVEVANTEAPIDLANINGEVKAAATNSSVRFTGSLHDDGRYDLKSMSGRVEMILPDNTNGFVALLTSYQGIVESDFKLKAIQPTIEGPNGRRLIGRFGNGKAQISLDSFDGLVRLTRAAPSSMESCK